LTACRIVGGENIVQRLVGETLLCSDLMDKPEDCEQCGVDRTFPSHLQETVDQKKFKIVEYGKMRTVLSFVLVLVLRQKVRKFYS
jgi:hypothetical protein